MSRPVAVVTGARRGIGLGVAEALAAKGFDLAITDIVDDGSVEPVCHGLRRHGGSVIYVASDITDLSSHHAVVERTVSAFGRIDCLVNNAGIGAVARGDPLDVLPENFDRVMAVNLRGTIFQTHEVARWMLANPTGDWSRSIIHVTSINVTVPSLDRLDYCISKAGLAIWSKGLAVRLAPEGIGVFDVRPGIIRTDMTAGVAAKYDVRIPEGLVPARRWGEVRDVANVIACLASGEFAFATGSVIDVDGGLSIPRV